MSEMANRDISDIRNEEYFVEWKRSLFTEEVDSDTDQTILSMNVMGCVGAYAPVILEELREVMRAQYHLDGVV